MTPPTSSTSTRSSRKARDAAREISHARHAGLSVPRVFTTPGSDPLEEVTYDRRTSRIVNTDGTVVFEMEGAEIPAGWSQVATDIVVSKYFRKAGVPQLDAKGNIDRKSTRLNSSH